jgi:hypothetical protein
MNDQTKPVADESVVELPATVEGAFEVYINGILQRPGTDYRQEGRTLIFSRRLDPEIKPSKREWIKGTLGIGTYRKHDTIDIIYHHAGRTLVATGLQPRTRT